MDVAENDLNHCRLVDRVEVGLIIERLYGDTRAIWWTDQCTFVTNRFSFVTWQMKLKPLVLLNQHWLDKCNGM